MEHFHIRISGDELVFSAAHFITMAGGRCEPLHGHNYRVAAEVHGPLDDDECVVDFHAIEEGLRSILAELDHRVLLAERHPLIHVAADGEEIEVRLADRRWVLPRGDCLLLPLANTTAELLAQYIARRLRGEVCARLAARASLVRIEVEESSGHLAVCELGAP